MRKAMGLSAVLAAVLVVAGAAIWMTTMPQTPTGEPNRATTVTETVHAVIGEWEGRVAVFAAGETTPQMVYDTWVRTLPDAEQQKLQDGIVVRDREELRRLLEDYTE